MQGADFYYWTIEPEHAGAVNGSDTAVTIVWSVDYYGPAYVRVCGMNNTGVGPVSDSLVVMVLEAPTATISGYETVCQGEGANLSVELTGLAPWSLVIDNESYTASSSPWVFSVAPLVSTTYTITSVEDAAGCLNAGAGSAQVDIMPVPGKAATPDGPATVNTDETQTSVYNTTGATNADDYTWEVTPADAYTAMTADGMSCTVTWAYPYTGPAVIRVKGTNDCGEGNFSDETNVTLQNSFGIDELARTLGLALYPNPGKGAFTLELATSAVDKVNLRILNAMGRVIYEKQNMKVNSSYSTVVDISSEPEGIYLLVVESDLGVYTGRVVLQK